MDIFEPVSIESGWRLAISDWILEVQGARLDRGVVRATLTVRKDDAICFRSTVNLTSSRGRHRLLVELADKGIDVDERVIIALDEACRTNRAGSPKRTCDSPPDISGTPALDLAGLKQAFSRWLLIEDDAFLPVLTGAVLAHRLGGEPVWLLLVAPPGGTKSEPLRTLYGYPGMYPLSDLTARTFASGLDKGDPSLLARLKDEILVLKDFTTVLEGQRDERQKILAQLREIYDGRFDQAWGTGRELHWQGRLGFIAGVTTVIDRHQAAMSVLGERFVLFRPVMPDRKRLARAALHSGGHEAKMREELARAMHGFLSSRASEPPKPSEETLTDVATVADFITRARSGVHRDGYKRELDYAPEPEAPTRLAKGLATLASGIALAYDSEAVGDREMRLVLRVALDCLPVIRRRVIAALVNGSIATNGDGTLLTRQIADPAGCSTSTIRRTLEDLHALEIVDCDKEGSADRWSLRPQWVEIFSKLSEAASASSRPFDGTVNGALPDAPRSPDRDAGSLAVEAA
jgi:hypothetical protein